MNVLDKIEPWTRDLMTEAEISAVIFAFSGAMGTERIERQIRRGVKAHLRHRPDDGYSVLIPCDRVGFYDFSTWGEVTVSVIDRSGDKLATIAFAGFPGVPLVMNVAMRDSSRFDLFSGSHLFVMSKECHGNVTRRYPLSAEHIRSIEMADSILFPADLVEYMQSVSCETAELLELHPLVKGEVFDGRDLGSRFRIFTDLPSLGGSVVIPVSEGSGQTAREKVSRAFLSKHCGSRCIPFAEGIENVADRIREIRERTLRCALQA